MKIQQHKYHIYPTLLDAYLNMANSDVLYEKYYGSSEAPQFTAEEFHEEKVKDLLDKINRVQQPTSEAAAKGTCLNEIVDCIIRSKAAISRDILVKSVRNVEEYISARYGYGIEMAHDDDIAAARELLAKIGKPFIYATHAGFSFCFDIEFCKTIAKYFCGCLNQFYTSAVISTAYGNVELYGFIDYLKEKVIYDLKTTKSYAFGNYYKYMQRYAYPYCMIESRMMTDVKEFEFTVYTLKGGTATTPLITGTQNCEVYTYDHKKSEGMLRETCDRFIEFVNNNIDKIDKKQTKIFL